MNEECNCKRCRIQREAEEKHLEQRDRVRRLVGDDTTTDKVLDVVQDLLEEHRGKNGGVQRQ